jgi:hypothetical protein
LAGISRYNNDNDGGWCGTVKIPFYTSNKKKVVHSAFGYASAAQNSGGVGPATCYGSGGYTTNYSGAIDGFDFIFADNNNNSPVNFNSGIIKVYGVG